MKDCLTKQLHLMQVKILTQFLVKKFADNLILGHKYAEKLNETPKLW